MAAVIGPVSGSSVRPSRRNLTAHQAVVDDLHGRGPVLPVRFGTVMLDAEQVVDEVLTPMAGELAEELRALEGKDEFRLRVRYQPDVALREAVQGSPQLRRARDRLARRPGSADMADRIALGELVVDELEQLRAADSQMVSDAVGAYAAAWTPLADRADDVAANLALLVDRRRRDALDEALSALAQKQAHRLSFQLTGPLAPWDFVDADMGPG